MDPNKVLDEFEILVSRIENSLECKIIVDVKVFHEVLLRAQRSLEKLKLDKIPRPHDYKKAGHYAFWLRKLKPFRVFRVSEVRGLLDHLEAACEVEFRCLNGLLADEAARFRVRNSHKYVNEIIAVWTGIAFVIGPERARDVITTPPFLRDLLAGLRYDAYTPDNLSLLFESIAQQLR